uniref:DNA mismatch repair protein MSH5 n=1 Tax=Watanabea reniformis TaxID=191674 RepID=A0A0K0MX16_9CHLO|nr:DNA mismatch repair protein MSH5 [Watanabea reniformis]
MSCLWYKNRLGVAFYDRLLGEMSVMQMHDDVTGPFAHQMLRLAKLQAQPHVVYTTSKAEPEFLACAREPLDAVAGATGLGVPDAGQVEVRLEKSSYFHPEQAWRCLELLHVRGMPEGQSAQERLHLLNTMINLSATQQVCAAGALVAILLKEGILAAHTPSSSLDDTEQPATGGQLLGLEGLSEIALEGLLLVDQVSLRALQIFQEEAHPSAMGIGQSKEGFSVFGMMNKCVSPMGKRLLKLWFLRPIINLDVLRERQAAIKLLMRAPDVIKSLQDVLRKIRDVPRVLLRLQVSQGLVNLADIKHLLEGMGNLVVLRDALLSAAESVLQPPAHNPVTADMDGPYPLDGTRYVPHGTISGLSSSPDLRRAQLPKTQRPVLGIVRKAVACIDDSLLTACSLVANVIDFEQAEEGMMVAHGVCDELDSLKHLYHGLPDFLTRVVEDELQRIPRELRYGLSTQLWSMIYMPQVGFVMRLEGQRLTADLEDFLPDFQFAFEGVGEEVSGFYYTSQRTQQLNQRFGDLLNKIHDLESSLCTEVIRRVSEFGPSINRAVAVAAEVDCLASLAQCANQYNYTQPTLTTENVLHIKQGRHLLTEMIVDTFIPNDTIMAADTARVQVITGPNFSGKSCYGKQAALIVFLAHIGSFVPAAEAVIGLTDRIFTRIASQEALTLPQSTFMIDLSQISGMLRHATGRSLCIIDEFGKGTLTTDGVGLLCCTLQHFSRMRPPPKVIACTHFSEVLKEAYLPRSPQLAFLAMNVLSGPEQAAGRNGQRLVFLYRLVEGYAAPSFGVHCAQLSGLADAILQRAIQVIELQQLGKRVARLPTQLQEQRDARFEAIVQKLLKLNTRSVGACEQFLKMLEK